MNRLRFTERDEMVFREFFEHKFLTAKQLTSLGYFPNEKKCRDRLHLLNKEGYIDFCQKPGFGKGRAEYVYYLKRKAMEIIQLLGCTTEEICAAKPAYSPFLLHHLAIVDFSICVRNACEKSGGYEAKIIPEYKRWKAGQGNLKKATSQTIAFKGSNFEIIPDAVMCFTRREDNLKSLLFLEIYRGTQTIESSKHSIQQKLEAYGAFLEQKSYGHFSESFSYPFNGFRVLIVVHSVSSLEKLKALCQKIAHGLFWLAVINDITPDTFFKPVWHVPGEEGLKALVKGGD